jgi:hypothetical protein
VTQTALASVTSAKTRDSRSWHSPYKGDAGVLLIQCELCSRYWTEEVNGGYCHCGCGGVGSPVKTGDRTEGGADKFVWAKSGTVIIWQEEPALKIQNFAG